MEELTDYRVVRVLDGDVKALDLAIESQSNEDRELVSAVQIGPWVSLLFRAPQKETSRK